MGRPTSPALPSDEAEGVETTKPDLEVGSFLCHPSKKIYGNGKSLFLTGDTSLNRWFSIVILVFRGVNNSAVELKRCTAFV